MQIITTIHLFRSPYTICFITEQSVSFPDKQIKFIGLKDASNVERIDKGELSLQELTVSNKKKLKLTTNALFLQPFMRECFNSEVYRRNVIRHLNELSGNRGTVFLKLILEPPDKEIIDYSWNARIQHLLWSRIEIENAFAWLSTLGGAYSALGDYFEHCAEEAGRISVRQYKLSKMLGDDSLSARSRLYSALAYSQKGNLKLARHIVRQVAEFARTTKDKRLNRMCQGVWAKLKYLRQLKKNRVGNLNGTTGCGNIAEVKV